MARDRRQYFNQLAVTSRKYYIPYLSEYMKIGEGVNVLEIGCGEGGNLLPFAQDGCSVLGVDLSEDKIRAAERFFAEEGAQGRFLASDIFAVKELEGQFDLILCHDVIEHISDKEEFMRRTRAYLRPGGIAFFAFPAWQMPFGGHQQMCHSKFCSHAPFLHLLPVPVYRSVLKAFHERPGCIGEMLDIKQCRTSIERFERLCKKHGLKVLHRQLWFINPHYKQKFRLTPRKLWAPLAHLPWLRNFFSTSCFYLTAVEKSGQ